MFEFAPGYRQVKTPSVISSYAAVPSLESPSGLRDGVARNQIPDADTIRRRRLGRDAFAFFAMSELALLAYAAFGKKRNTSKIRKGLTTRRVIKGVVEAVRLPYTLPSINLL